MSHRARRLTRPTAVAPFDWGGWATATRPPSASRRQAAASPERTADAGPDSCAADAGAPTALEAVGAEHAARLQALERDAFARGFAQGERAGAEAAAERGKAMLRRLAETLEELAGLRARIIHETERQVVQLALAIARKVIHREVSIDHDLLAAIARVALDRLGESTQVVVRLNPDDHAVAAGAGASAWPVGHVTVVADPRVPPGGCRVESELGVVDAGVDAQITEIARALLGESPQGAEVPIAR
jgi:flagellar assembly protein FliH